MDTQTQAVAQQVAAFEGQGTKSLEGKYLTFHLADEEYGIEILKVIEIIGMIDITYVPRTPEFVKGVINLRGKVIPVVDLRLKFGLPEAEHTKETCVVVVDIDGSLMGIIVDAVSEVLDIAGADIEPAPGFGSKLDTSFILGMGKTSGRVSILLDIARIMSTDELTLVEQLGE